MNTVINLLQKLNLSNVFDSMLLCTNSILFTSCVIISVQYLEYYAIYSLFHLKGSKLKVTKMELKLKSAFQ